MADPIEKFFDDVSGREFDARLATVKGTLSFTISGDGDQSPWFVEIDRGRLRVSREPREADAVVHANRAEFSEMVTGRDRVVSAVIRGAVTVDGNLRLLLRFQRLMPAASGARDPRELSNVVARGGRS